MAQQSAKTGLSHRHLIDITEYSEEDIMLLLQTAHRFREVNERRIKKVPVTSDGKLVGTLSRRNIMHTLANALEQVSA